MIIAVTADVHLASPEDHPERYNALENIFEQAEGQGIEVLVIAGDLFDKDFCTYAQFERLCRAHPSVHVHIIPGNHDSAICDRNIVGETIHIHNEPTALQFGPTTFLFVPYEPQATMAEKIVEMEKHIQGRPWVLVGHGDYYRGMRERNPLEPGTYMPLSAACVDRYKPRAVLLGHIHKPLDLGLVHYAGSPCGLDISETGRRRFLVYDTEDGSIVPRPVETDILHFQEVFVVLPTDDEAPLLERRIADRIDRWGIEPQEFPKVRLRVEAVGYARNRGGIRRALERGFGNVTFHKDLGPDIDGLRYNSDRQLMAAAQRALELIDEIDWPFGGDQPLRQDVVLEALSVIYGV